jgi:hypothetical protein
MSGLRNWWGYQHINKTLQVKPYLQPLDIQEAKESPFCELVFGPFLASDRDEALITLNELIGEYKCGVDEQV